MGGLIPASIYTIGHSTRTSADFLKLLEAHGITHLADVRTVPRSRRHPHFSREALAAELSQAGIEYRHFPGLGGLRKPQPDSLNSAWQNASFRGYADHMRTADFDRAFQELMDFAAPEPTAIMCAEALWWRCHRALLSDALEMRGVEVLHIDSRKAPRRHRVTEFARERNGRPIYPGLI